MDTSKFEVSVKKGTDSTVTAKNEGKIDSFSRDFRENRYLDNWPINN